MSTTIRVGSTGLNVSDLDRAARFYERVLGLTTIRRGSDAGFTWAHLGIGEEVMLTLWEQSSKEIDHRAAGLHHISFELASVSDLADAEKRLRGIGARLRGSDPQAQSGQVFCFDPDGIRVELYTEQPTPPIPPGSVPRCGFYEELEARGTAKG